MKKQKILLTSAMALGITFGSSTIVHAVETAKTIPNGTTTIDKYLIMDADAHTPNAEFTIDIEPGKAVAGNATHFDIKAGIGKPVVQSVKFDPDQKGLDSISEADNNKITLEKGKKYVKGTFSVDFKGIPFNEPGIYRYVVTETSKEEHGIKNDSDKTRLLDVYILSDENGKLQAPKYILHNGEDGSSVDLKNAKLAKKSVGFINNYETNDLTLSKKVTGNQGSHDQYFKFTVDIKNAVAGTVYDVDLSNAEVDIQNSSAGSTSHNNPSVITVGKDGNVTQEFWLKHGQSIVVKGIAEGTAYTITEDNGMYAVSTKSVEGKNQATEGKTSQVADDNMTDDTIVEYINSREGTVPTGIMLNVLPGAFVCLAGGIGCTAVILSKRRKEEK